MKSFLLAAAASLALIAGASPAQAQDRAYRGPQSGYNNNNNNRGWNDDDDRRYRGYDQGQWNQRNGYYWNGDRRISRGEYMRWRQYQRARQARAYQQGMRDGRRQAYRNNRGCGNGRW